MKKFIRNGWFVIMLCVGLFAFGCASNYYKVTDPLSGSVYYTQEVKSVSGGAVKLKDARSDSTVTLQNSQVKEIGEKEYTTGLSEPVAPVSKPTPTAAPAPAPVAAPAPAPVAAPAPAPAAEPAPAPAAEPAPAPAAEPAPAPAAEPAPAPAAEPVN